ncbi:MAG: DUF1565 domain-containing protein [candidate division Zixibacteria bacterium]|nr:DUF1565 domain-containing protein [candidate division Zixibacteria bacterium]
MKKVILLAVLLGAFIVLNCNDDPTRPVDGEVSINVYPVTASTAYLGDSTLITVKVYNTQNESVTWYVNDIAGGNDIMGTIEATSDTTGLYTAPSTAPDDFDTVIVKAVSQADTTKSDYTVVYILDEFLLHVDTSGVDATGKGTVANPFRTISRALVSATEGQTVRVGTGTFNEAGGETLPLTPGSEVTVQGQGIDTTFVESSSSNPAFQLQNELATIQELTIRGSDRASSIGVEFNGDANIDNLSLAYLKIENCRIAANKAGLSDSISFKNNEVTDCVYGLVIDQPGAFLGLDGTIFTDIDSVAVDIVSQVNPTIDFLDVTIDGALIGLNMVEGSFAIIQSSNFANIDSAAVILHDISQLEGAFPVGNNDFSGCENLCVYNASADTILARGNIWPDTNMVIVDSLYIYDDDEDDSLGPVIYE